MQQIKLNYLNYWFSGFTYGSVDWQIIIYVTWRSTLHGFIWICLPCYSSLNCLIIHIFVYILHLGYWNWMTAKDASKIQFIFHLFCYWFPIFICFELTEAKLEHWTYSIYITWLVKDFIFIIASFQLNSEFIFFLSNDLEFYMYFGPLPACGTHHRSFGSYVFHSVFSKTVCLIHFFF